MLPPRGVEFHSASDWGALIEGLRIAGHEVYGFGVGAQEYDALVAMNDQRAVRQLQTRYSIGPGRSVLIVLEPRVTAPVMYTNGALRRYGLRYAASPLWSVELGAQCFPWPQHLGSPVRAPGPSDYAATMINGDKRSAVAGSLYGLRRDVIRKCDAAGIRLAVFGPGWGASTRERIRLGTKAVARAIKGLAIPHAREAFGDLSQRPSSWLGPVADKGAAFAAAPVSLVIENSADYVSEKLVDAIRGGVVPIYVGPSLREFGYPDEVAVTTGASSDSVVHALTSLGDSQAEEIVEAGRRWLASEEAQVHEIRHVLTKLGATVGRQLR